MSETIDYQPTFKIHRTLRRLRRIGFWLAILCLCIVMGAASYVVAIFYDVHRKAAAFDHKTSETIIIGKTPIQVISLLGSPDADEQFLGHEVDRLIAYEDPTGEVCRIEFTKGVATKVEHYMK